MITLSEIRNTYIDHIQNEAILAFLGSVISDRGILQSKQKLFYSDVDKNVEEVFRVIDESYFKKYKPREMKRIQFDIDRGVVKEFFGNKPFSLELPINQKGKDITEMFKQYFLAVLAKEKLMDDLLFTIFRNVTSILGVYYDASTKTVAFGTGQRVGKVKAGSTYTNVTVKDITLEEVLECEIAQGYVNKDVGDPDRQYAYGHLLRAHAGFKLFEWAKNIVVTWARYNVVATSRGQGKTYFAALTAARELLKPGNGFGGRNYRTIKYFVPDKENIGNEVMQYVESLLGDLVDKRINGKPIFEIQRAKFSVKCNLTGNTFKIISLHGLGKNRGELGISLGEGISCDFAIVDEACRIPNDFWTSFHQRAVFETDRFLLISTINEETPVDHFFYKLLVEGEGGDQKVSSHRVTIDENEVMRTGRTLEEWKEALDRAKREMREKSEKELYAKGFCIILEESNVFNTSTYLVSPNVSKYSDSDPRILGFDLGKLTDTCGLVLINLKHREIEESKKVLNATYGTQLEYAKDYKKRFKNLLVIGDRSGVGEAVSEQDTEGTVDVWVKSTGTGELSYNKRFKYYTCSKGTIITTFATVLNTNMLKIPADQTDILQQMNDFVKMKSGRGEVILYKGKGKAKDDLVLSGAYAVLYMYAILGMKSVKEIEEYVAEVGNSQTYAYNDMEDGEHGTGLYHNGLY